MCCLCPWKYNLRTSEDAYAHLNYSDLSCFISIYEKVNHGRFFLLAAPGMLERDGDVDDPLNTVCRIPITARVNISSELTTKLNMLSKYI